MVVRVLVCSYLFFPSLLTSYFNVSSAALAPNSYPVRTLTECSCGLGNLEGPDYFESTIDHSALNAGGSDEAEEMRDMAEECIGRVRTREDPVDRGRLTWREDRFVFRRDLDLDFL